MPARGDFKFFINIECSFDVRMDGGLSTHSGATQVQSNGLSFSSNSKEDVLFTAANELQRQADKYQSRRTEKERRSDELSLSLLEAATVSQPVESRNNDRESLEVLMRQTDCIKRSSSTIESPAQSSFSPSEQHLKKAERDSQSYPLPFSISSVNRDMETPGTGNEFEYFLVKDAMSSHRGSVRPTEKPRSPFSAFVASPATSNQRTGPSSAQRSESMRAQVDSVSALMAKVEVQDAEADLVLEQALTEAMESQAASPTAKITRLPRDINESVAQWQDAVGNTSHDLKGAPLALREGADSETCVRASEAGCRTESELDHEWDILSNHSD